MPIPRATPGTVHGEGSPGPSAGASLTALAYAWALVACAAGAAAPTPAQATTLHAVDGGSPDPSASDAAVAEVFLDGVYAAPSLDARGAALGWDYVRFFGNGAVVTVSAPGQVENAWVSENDPHSAKGGYAIHGQTISFSASSAFGVVDYFGTIDKDRILLRWRSRINGREGGGVYAYIPLPPSPAAPQATAEGAPPDEALKPPGSGWFCTHPTARATGTSRCARTVRECQTYRRFVATKSPRERMSECAEQATALCHTTKERTGDTTRCYEGFEECTQTVAKLRASKPPRGASDCAVW